jgi:hypothetical protein
VWELLTFRQVRSRVESIHRYMLCRSGLAIIAALITFNCAAQTEPRILAFDKSGALVWTNVIPGHYYSVQSKPALNGVWTNVSGKLDNLQATGATMIVSVPVQSVQAFYTVVDRGSCCQNTGGPSLGTATDLGNICGDQSGSTLSVSGCGNGWFKIRIRECNGLLSLDLAAKISLQSPAGADYDLYVYRDGIPTRGSTSGPGLEEVSTSQTDTTGDNSYDLIIEVRRIDAYPCTNWTLHVDVP